MNVKNQTNYFNRILRILKELKDDSPDVDIGKHIALAISENDIFSLSEKELFQLLQKHKMEMDINTLSDKDLYKIISDTDELFQEVEYPDFDNLIGEDDSDNKF